MKRLFKIAVWVSLVVPLSTFYAVAQCAMCRAAVENNISEGSAGLSAGLNTGILYLFVTPYLMVALIGFLWYWKSKHKDAIPLKAKSDH